MSSPVRVAVIDSGVNPAHPHVSPITGGIHVTANGLAADYVDRLGHGTAVTGAIREKAPRAEIWAVKVFDRSLSTTGPVLLRALEWCIEARFDFVNLSLGTLNPAYRPMFQQLIERALSTGSTVVSANQMRGEPALPGSLPGVVSVAIDPGATRWSYRVEQLANGAAVYLASGYPREIPGVPPERNLQGISFAVANVTGLLAAERLAESQPAWEP